jgi:hypothetical protein
METRLAALTGSVEMIHTQAAGEIPRVYIAHASEDQSSVAKPLAERLMASGIDVWLDERESARR